MTHSGACLATIQGAIESQQIVTESGSIKNERPGSLEVIGIDGDSAAMFAAFLDPSYLRVLITVSSFAGSRRPTK